MDNLNSKYAIWELKEYGETDEVQQGKLLFLEC